MNINILVDHFVDSNDQETALVLLKTLAYPEQGGLGYKLKLFNPSIDLEKAKRGSVQLFINFVFS